MDFKVKFCKPRWYVTQGNAEFISARLGRPVSVSFAQAITFIFKQNARILSERGFVYTSYVLTIMFSPNQHTKARLLSFLPWNNQGRIHDF
jgi:hypothetical protein